MHRLTDTALEEALMGDTPSGYLDAHSGKYPQLDALRGVTQPPEHHMEGDAFVHTLMVVDEAAKRRSRVSDPLAFMLSALCHDMGKTVCTAVTDGKVHALRHELEGIPIAMEFLSLVGAGEDIREYVADMTKLHMKPNMMAKAHSSIKKTDHLFDDAAHPYDLIMLAVCDGMGKIPPSSDEEFLVSRYETYKQIMARPYVTRDDLIAAGVREDRLDAAAEFAHKLRLAGIDKDNTLRQTLSQY